MSGTPGTAGSIGTAGLPTAAGDPQSRQGIYGLYFFFIPNRYTTLFPDGHFLDDVPRWTPDGAFDWPASKAAARGDGWYGTFRVDGDAKSAAGADIFFTYANGRTETNHLTPEEGGVWRFKSSMRGAKIMPAGKTHFEGSVQYMFSATVGGQPNTNGGTDPTLTVGGFETLMLLPGDRFFYKSNTYQQGNNGSANGGATQGDWAELQGKSSGGSYRIHDIFITLTFDDGKIAEDIFNLRTPEILMLSNRKFIGHLR